MRKMPRLKVLLGSLLLVAALLAVAVVPVAAQTYFSPFSGDVTIDGEDAPIGKVVEAYIDGTSRASTTTKLGHYNLVITGGAADVDSAVSFKVDGVDATATPPNPTFQLNPQTVDLASGGVPGTYTLTMAVSGSGTTDPAADTITTYGAGTEVNIAAEPATGWYFVNWTGDVDTVADVTDPTTQITMNGGYTVTANFALRPVGDYPVLSWWLTNL